MILWFVEYAVEMLLTTVWTAREIIFSCVLLKVKNLYPHPSGQLNKEILYRYDVYFITNTLYSETTV